MLSIRSQMGRGVAVATASLALSTALCVACGRFDASSSDAPVPLDAADDSARTSDSAGDAGIDPLPDAARAEGGDGASNDGATSGCNDMQPFGSPVELADLGDVTSVRLEPSAMPGAPPDRAFVSFFASVGDEDIDEGPYPKAASLYAHAVMSAEGDTHPAPVTSDLRLVYEHGAVGARQIVLATRAQSGQKFTGSMTLPLAVDSAQTREPWALGDGSVVYFTMEPGMNGGRDVYRGELTGSAWNVAIVDGVSTAANEGHPVVSDDELTIFFSHATASTGPGHVWMATRASKSASFSGAAAAAGLEGLTGGGGESDDRPTWLSADRCTLLFVSNRSGAYRAYAASRH